MCVGQGEARNLVAWLVSQIEDGDICLAEGTRERRTINDKSDGLLKLHERRPTVWEGYTAQ